MNPRALAIEILARVRATDAYLNVVLDAQLSEHSFSDPRDAALVTELCYGATRRQLALDYAIARFADRRLEQMEDRVLSALRLGAYQLFYLRTPRHAAVGETIQALKLLRLERAAGFVNALLRKLSALDTQPLPPSSDEPLLLSVRESHPLWIVNRWIRQFGLEQARSMLEAANLPAPLVMRVNTAAAIREDVLRRFREAGHDVRPTQLSPQGVFVTGAGNPQELPGYAEGLWQIQDEAAQLVVPFADVAHGARVLDACAAPGTKACQLAERLEVVAADLHPNKLSKLRSEAERLGVMKRMQMLVHDATTPFPEALGNFQAVLVDAPCSGLGILRRHPELRYRRKEEDIGRLANLQGAILENCQERVVKGGLLVYSVCSVDPQEGEEQVDAFLRAHPNFFSEIPVLAFDAPIKNGFLRTFPNREGLDGFFAARLRRRY
jgi:16S rRNA (cytosine967-C5)-methyltransferase